MNRLLWFLRPGLAIALLVGVVWVITHRDLLDADRLAALLHRAGPWAPAVFILIYATGTVLLFSGAILSFVGGALFGPVWGTLWNLSGALLGATIAFLIARRLGSAWIEKKVGGRLQRLIDGVTAEGWRFVALMRLVPFVPFDILNYALGLTRISLRAYVVTSAICMIPGAVAYTWLGFAGRSAAEGDTAALRYGLVGLGVLAIIVFVPRLLRRFRSRS